MSSNQPSILNLGGGLSVAPAAPLPISHPPSRSFGSLASLNRSLASLNHSSRPRIATLHESGSTTSRSRDGQFRMGNTVVNTLSDYSYPRSTISSNPSGTRTSTSFSGRGNQLHALPPQRSSSYANSCSETGREVFAGRGTHVGGHNCGILRNRRANTNALVWNDTNMLFLSNSGGLDLGYNNSTSSNASAAGGGNETTFPPQTEDSNDLLIECEKCKLWLSHKIIDDHIVAHDFEATFDSGNSRRTTICSSSSGMISFPSFSSSEPTFPETQNLTSAGSAAREEPAVSTASIDSGELEALVPTPWRGLARRRSILWPFVRLSSSRAVREEETNVNNNGSASNPNETNASTETNNASISNRSNESESLNYSREGIVVRATQNSHNGLTLDRNNTSDGSSRSNAYVYDGTYNAANYRQSSLIFSPYNGAIDDEQAEPASTYRTMYSTPASRYSGNLSLSSYTYPSVPQPRRAYSMNQRTTFSHGNYVYPIRSPPTSTRVADTSENTSPLSQVSISLLPTSVFDAERSSSLLEVSRTCAICLEEYVTGDCQRRLPCTHVYHETCIDAWLKKSRLCPVCKFNVNP